MNILDELYVLEIVYLQDELEGALERMRAAPAKEFKERLANMRSETDRLDFLLSKYTVKRIESLVSELLKKQLKKEKDKG